MAQHYENRTIDGAVELLKTNGFDALADAVTVLLNAAMVAERSDYPGVSYTNRLLRTNLRRTIIVRQTLRTAFFSPYEALASLGKVTMLPQLALLPRL